MNKVIETHDTIPHTLYTTIREIIMIKATIIGHKNYLEKGYNKSVYRTMKREEANLKSSEARWVELCKKSSPQDIAQAYQEATGV